MTVTRVLVPLVIVLAIILTLQLTGVFEQSLGKPFIHYFNANPEVITKGSSSTLDWDVSRATIVVLEMAAEPSSGSRVVTPVATTEYTLRATNEAGSVFATTLVTVNPEGKILPAINDFTASPPSISPGIPTTLSWNVSNATDVTIDNDVGSVGLLGKTTRYLLTTTIYTLTATSGAGSVTATVLVTVNPKPEAETKHVVIDWVYKPNGTPEFSGPQLTFGITTLSLGTLNDTAHCGFVFETREVTDTVADIYFFYDDRDKQIAFWANNGNGGIHDMGNVSLDSITTAPDKSNGVGVFNYYNSQATPTIVGHTYCVVTKDGEHYAKFQVKDLVY